MHLPHQYVYSLFFVQHNQSNCRYKKDHYLFCFLFLHRPLKHLAISIFQALQCYICTKSNLMGWIPEFCQHPKLLSRNYTIHIIGYIVINLIICHSSNHNIIGMTLSASTSNYEIQPFSDISLNSLMFSFSLTRTS